MLGQRLKELRNSKNLTQDEIAKKLHLTRSTYAQYEVDRRVPEYGTLEKLADFFDVSIDYLVGRTNDPNRVLQPHSRKTIDLFEQNKSAEEIFQAFNGQFLVGGLPMAKDEALFIIDYLRTKWAREMKPDHASSKQ